MSTKRKRSTSPTQKVDKDDVGTTIFRSETIADRQSTFIGFYSPSLKPEELQHLAEFKDASHKVLGWRRESNQQSLTAAKKYVTGHDDDGEKFGGKKVEQCLVNSSVIGACVVARWYGGVMLGPVRFTHMETCALGAIQTWRTAVEEEMHKKRKVEDDIREQKRLVTTLAARDQSIAVLRGLANEKEAKLRSLSTDANGDEQPKQTAVPGESAPSSTPTQIVYDDMPLERLRGLERARDATLSFLLKRIDKAELALKRADSIKELRDDTTTIEAG